MKRILVPSDLSDISENALKLASAVAAKTGAKIFLINFIDHPFGESFSSNPNFESGNSNQEDLFTIKLIQDNRDVISNESGLAVRY